MSPPGSGASPARAFVDRWFGRNTTTIESRPTVGASAAVLVAQNPNRLAYLLSNRSGSNIDLGEDATVAAGNGLPVAGNGGTLIMLVDEDGEAVTRAMFAVGPVAGLSMYLLEVVAL